MVGLVGALDSSHIRLSERSVAIAAHRSYAKQRVLLLHPAAVLCERSPVLA